MNKLELLKEAYKKWGEDRASRTAAALSFFTALSLSPLLLLSLSLAGMFFSGGHAKEQLMSSIQNTVGSAGVEAITPMLESASKPGKGLSGTILSFFLLALGASGLYAHVQQAFDDLWKVPPSEGGGIKQAVLSKISSLAATLVAATFLLGSMGLTVAVAFVKTRLPLPAPLLALLDFGGSILVFALVLALVFREIPQTDIAWGDVLGPGLFTAVLFVLGKLALGLYLGSGAAGSAFGAAGSLFVLLLWLFYIGQIVLFGAEVSYVYAHKYGSKAP